MIYLIKKFIILLGYRFFWKNDHTKRLTFYISRLTKNEPLMVINSGENICQIAYVEDLAKLLLSFLKKKSKSIINALPTQGIRVINFIECLKKHINSNSKIINISEQFLKERFRNI